MKKSLPLVIILTVFVFVPAIVGAAQNGKGTGIFPFALVPFIIFALLLHFLFKVPSEMVAPARAPAYAKTSSKAIAKEKTVEPEELTTIEPAAAGEPEVTCPECGCVVTMFDISCPHCGVKFEGETATAETTQEGQPSEALVEELEPLEAPGEVITLSERPEEVRDVIGFGLKCPTCGGSVGIEEKFCPHCGSDFEKKEEEKVVKEETGGDKTEEELDKLFGIAPEEPKPEPEPEQKPASQPSGDITISYEEPEEVVPVKKKGKKRK
jgi:uncharacterized OB-fold protein